MLDRFKRPAGLLNLSPKFVIWKASGLQVPSLGVPEAGDIEPSFNSASRLTGELSEGTKPIASAPMTSCSNSWRTCSYVNLLLTNRCARSLLRQLVHINAKST